MKQMCFHDYQVMDFWISLCSYAWMSLMCSRCFPRGVARGGLHLFSTGNISWKEHCYGSILRYVHLPTWRLRASYIFVYWHDKEHDQQKTRTTLQRWCNQRTFETQTPTKFNFRAPTTKYMSCQAIERHEKTFHIWSINNSQRKTIH